jgi:gliding motility-associated-like protein
MRKILLFSLIALSFSNLSTLKAQTCFGAFAGVDINLPCNVTCTPFTATIPEIRSTEDYTVGSIPYNPYPFVTTAPALTLSCSNQDDKFFPTSNLPFPFCFYGVTYNQFVVGTNGLITFDVSNNLNCNHWDLSPPSAGPIPWTGPDLQCASTSCPTPSGTLYPRASIMGVYQDIDIDKPSPNKKMEFRIEGTAPCRRAIISFNEIANFSCSVTSTTMIVIYESTGIIEVYVRDKPSGCSWNNDAAILGIQDWTRMKGLAPPNRNLGSWGTTGMNEAWQFKPNGSTSLLDHVELVLNGVVVATGTLGTLSNGYYNVDFGNVCPPIGNNQYVVRGVYKVCNDNPATFYFIEDTVEINRIAPFFANADTTSPACNGLSTGQVVFNPVGTTAPYEYSIDGGTTYTTNNTFSGLAAGTYNFKVRDVNGCIKDTVIIITEPTALTAIAITSDATCPNNDGTIDITAGGGTPGYEFSINNGSSWQPGNIFSNLPAGNYNNIRIRDANGCITNATVVVPLNDTMRLELGSDSSICAGSSITLIPQTNALTDTFRWTPAATLNFDTARTPIATPLDTTKYYLTAKWGICTRTDSITVNVKQKPVPFAGNDTTICYKTNALLHGSASNLSGTVNYSWSPADSLDTPNAAVTNARIDTTRTFYLTVTDNYGCNFSVVDSMTVTMMPQLVVFAGNDTNAILNRPHQLMASGGVNYVWSPAGPLNNPFIANPLATLSNDTYFTVTVTDAIGCIDDDDVFIKVYEGPMYYLPNAFTPNGDGLNDIFVPIPVGIQSTSYFRVFNRYGQLMFQTTEWMKGWDGTFKGKTAEPGTYVWMIKGVDKNGADIEMKGTVILLK